MSIKPAPIFGTLGQTYYDLVMGYTTSGLGFLIWDRANTQWTTWVEANRDDYPVWRVPLDYPTNASRFFIQHPSDYPDWDLDNEGYMIYTFAEDQSTAETGTGTLFSHPDDLLVWVQEVGVPISRLGPLLSGMTLGIVVADGGNTSSTFKTDLTEDDTDYFQGGTLTFYTGANKGQTRRLPDTGNFNPTTDFITVQLAFDSAPTAGDKFYIFGRIN